MATVQQYRDAAKTRLREVLDQQLAVVKPEALARLSEANFRSAGGNIDPHHVGAALAELITAGEIVTKTETSKGGHRITTYAPADQWKRRTAVQAAEARKRALYARYQGWAQGSVRYPEGLIGPAGEAATRSGVIDSAALQPAQPGAGGFNTILGTRLPGQVDTGGFMTWFKRNIPQPPVTVLIEVKNVRQWIYPNSSELYQVLHKGVVLQQAHPEAPIVPVLVCRAAHPTTFFMAKQLGFAVIAMGIQFVGDVDETVLDEVRNELHFNDLHVGNGPSLRVRDRLRSMVTYIPKAAGTWQASALDDEEAGLIGMLRNARSADREPLVNQLRQRDLDLGGQGGW